MPSSYRINPDAELGFVPLLAAAPAAIGAVGGIAKGIGGLFKKKKKAAPAQPVKQDVSRAGSVSKSKASSSRQSAPAVGAGLMSVPTDVKQDALAALQSYQKTNQASTAKQAALVKKLAAVVAPQVKAMKAQIANQALKSKVTQEHKKLVKNDERWAANDAAHKAIMAKFDQLEAALQGSNQSTKRVFKIYGINA